MNDHAAGHTHRPQINRHYTGITAEFAQECHDHAMTGAIGYLMRAAAKDETRSLRLWQGGLATAAAYGVWLDRDMGEIAYLLRERGRAVATIGELMQPGDREVEFGMDGVEPFFLKQGLLKDSPVQVGDHIDAVYCAAITRDDQTMQRLLALDVDRLVTSGVTTAGYMHQLGEAQRATLLQHRLAPILTLAALRATDPSQANQSFDHHAAMIASPAAELLARLAANRAEDFETSLYTALDAHRQYYSFDVYGRQFDPSGFLCLPALAAAAIAHDRGWSFNVVSDYMPADLVKSAKPKRPGPC
ncbi:immunity 49 family protein [Tabrizicola sp.]|uniref:immunity 49 family protein n=1 Tax=Tabrizicola sp. TaxID=2005166 RepID=UPI003F2A3819